MIRSYLSFPLRCICPSLVTLYVVLLICFSSFPTFVLLSDDTVDAQLQALTVDQLRNIDICL